MRGEDAVARMTGFANRGPNRVEADECELDSRHSQSIKVLFADGHVRAISDDVDQNVYQGMARRSRWQANGLSACKVDVFLPNSFVRWISC